MEESDELLCARSANGDRMAEEALVLRYGRLVRICARPYFLIGADAEDLMQEGMLGLISAIREFSPTRGASFRTYAGLCIRRRIISAIRTAAGDKHAPLNTYVSFETPVFSKGQQAALFAEKRPELENPEDLFISRERQHGLKQLIYAQLTALEREILTAYLSGLSYIEIAQEVNRPTKSVDNAVQRIRRKLARQLLRSEYSGS